MTGKVITGMVAIGDPMYYDLAQLSAPSFLWNNPSSDLVIFTDQPERFSQLKTDFKRVAVENYPDWLSAFKDVVDVLETKIDHGRADFKYTDHFHKHIYIAAFIPVLQRYAEQRGYHWCLKVDADSYFAGGDLFDTLRQDTAGWTDKKDLYVVEQCHPEMHYFDECGVPTAGFIMWKTSGKFCDRYLAGFHENEQATFWDRLGDGTYLRTCRLLRPGYHMVYPFHKNPEFSKADASRFFPAYFHLGGVNLVRQQQLMDGWFNQASKYKDVQDWR